MKGPAPPPASEADGERLPAPSECLTPQERMRCVAELYLKAMRRYMAEQAKEAPASKAEPSKRPDEGRGNGGM